jgi:hypothetical protein
MPLWWFGFQSRLHWQSAITGGLNAVGAVTVMRCVVVVCASASAVNNTNVVALSVAVLIMTLALLFPLRSNFQATGILPLPIEPAVNLKSGCCLVWLCKHCVWITS